MRLGNVNFMRGKRRRTKAGGAEPYTQGFFAYAVAEGGGLESKGILPSLEIFHVGLKFIHAFQVMVAVVGE